MNNKPKIIVISGATATGKTNKAIEMAQLVGGEIVNFDSLLFYQELSIGTAKPTSEEINLIPHHLVGIASIKNPLNARDFELKARPIIHELHQRKVTPILVGGSGFYLQALLHGMYDSITPGTEILERSEKLYLESGIEPFRELLRLRDNESFLKLHANDHYRIRRAVEHFWSTGTPFSTAALKQKQQKSDAKNSLPWEVLHLYFDIPKSEHLPIIEERTQKMLTSGLVQEVQELLQMGFTGEERPLKSIGYYEVIRMLRGEITSLQACKEAIIISTRQLAKSQRTWFKRIDDKIILNPLTQKEEILFLARQFLGQSP